MNLAQVLGSNTAYIGFTAGTWAAWETHEILKWEFLDSPIFWYGDQATCDGTYAPYEGSFRNGNNWLNYIPAGPSNQAAFYAELPAPLQSSGTIEAAPYKIRFGDFNDNRPLGCSGGFILGGPTTVGSVVVGSGKEWEFYFNSNSPVAPPNSAPLNVLGYTKIAYDSHPNTNFYNVPYSITPAGSPRLHIHSGTMTSGSVTIGGTPGSPLLGDSGSGELKIASDAVLSSPSVTVAQGGVLSGNGRVIGTVNCNGGKIVPGNSAGTLTIQGDLRVSAGSEVILEVGGLAPGVSYDQLVTTGSAQISGTVRISFTGGFAPLAGDSFDFFGPSGFTSNGTTFVSDPGVQFNVQGNRVLAVVAIPTPSAEYQSWRQSKFGSINSREGEPRANLDGDISDNFTEFLFNLNPTISDYHSLEAGSGSSGLPVVLIVPVGSEKRIAFEFIRHKRVGPYSVQTSADLQTWTTEANPVIDSIVSVSADYERVRILEPLPIGNPDSNRRFFRISVAR